MLAILAGMPALGCGRVLTIKQGAQINTGTQYHRPVDQRTGEPLEVDIVCVFPHNLDNELNSRLAPGAGITSDVWFENRPIPGDKIDAEGNTRFRLAQDQIFVLTDNANVFGKRLGPSLRGSVVDGKDKIKVTFPFNGSLHDKNSVIYIFPQFFGPDGKLLRVAPVIFNPPGVFANEMSVEIGVNDSGANFGQYITNTTKSSSN